MFWSKFLFIAKCCIIFFTLPWSILHTPLLFLLIFTHIISLSFYLKRCSTLIVPPLIEPNQHTSRLISPQPCIAMLFHHVARNLYVFATEIQTAVSYLIGLLSVFYRTAPAVANRVLLETNVIVVCLAITVSLGVACVSWPKLIAKWITISVITFKVALEWFFDSLICDLWFVILDSWLVSYLTQWTTTLLAVYSLIQNCYLRNLRPRSTIFWLSSIIN